MSFRERAQTLVNSLDQGAGLAVLRGFLCVVVVGSLFLGYAYSQFRGLREPEAMESAHIARRLAAGRGFTTLCLRPADLEHLQVPSADKEGAAGWPDLRNAPAFPALLALAFRLIKPDFSAGDALSAYAPELHALLPTCMLLAMTTGLFLFLLGRQLFDTRTGALATALFFLTDTVLADTVAGTAVPMLMLITSMTAYLAVLVAAHKKAGHRLPLWLLPLAGAALLCGLAFLTHYLMAVLLVCMGLFTAVVADRRRVVAVLTFLILFAAITAPWLARNQRLTGNPLGLASYAVLKQSPLYEDDALDRTPAPDWSRHRAMRAATVKFKRHVAELYDEVLPALGSGLLMCFFLVSFFCRFEGDEANRFRWFAGLGLLLLMAGVALWGPDATSLLHAFLPLIALYGTACFLELSARATSYDPTLQGLVTWIMVLLTALPATLTVSSATSRPAYPPYFPPFISYACGLLEPEEMVCTDIPWATAWYGNRPSLLLPRNVDDLLAVHNGTMPVSAVYLTTETGNKPLTRAFVSGPETSWLPLLNRTMPAGFPWPHGIAFPPGTQDQIFLTDRVRWPPTSEEALAEDRIEKLEVRPAE